MQRQQDLEKYLQTLAHMVQHQIPLVFVEFLDFHKYDVVFLLQKLAMDFSQKFNNNKTWTFTILEVRFSRNNFSKNISSQFRSNLNFEIFLEQSEFFLKVIPLIFDSSHSFTQFHPAYYFRARLLNCRTQLSTSPTFSTSARRLKRSRLFHRRQSSQRKRNFCNI